MTGTAAVKRHMASIAAICAEVGRPFEEIAGVYQCELLRLTAQAAVHDYLPVLVGKRVRALYRRRLHALDDSDPCARLVARI